MKLKHHEPLSLHVGRWDTGQTKKLKKEQIKYIFPKDAFCHLSSYHTDLCLSVDDLLLNPTEKSQVAKCWIFPNHSTTVKKVS